MEISALPVTDVRGLLTAQRARLLSLLGSLDDAQWAAPTSAPSWLVKDIALHLLDVDLSWLARDRDGDQSGLVPVPAGHQEFVRGLARRNQRWVDGARMLSHRLITSLLAWSGQELDAYLGSADLARDSAVYWAGAVPLWFDLAREFTERWVHGRQIREAVTPAGEATAPDEYLALVLRTFVWGFPHQYRVPAAPDTTIALEIPGAGTWTLTRAAARWELDEGRPATPSARLRMSGEAAWRLLTGGPYDVRQVELDGDPALTGPLLAVRGVIV